MKNILITGGTGSFGRAITRRLLEEDQAQEIAIFSRDEFKQHLMREEMQTDKIRFVVGDVRDESALEEAMEGVDTVFHAAALKQVPTGEYYPAEMVKTNVMGTKNVLEVARKNSTVRKVVLLSTDKAVYPVNTMGISKALAEKLVASAHLSDQKTVYCAVRYGNVMVSRGSVIPLFINHIKAGRQIPVTNPDMTRFLLNLDDAIDLVLLAIDCGASGDLFIKKAPAAKIGELAQALLNVFGAKNDVVTIGTRAGEKVHETLATRLELARAEDLGNHYRIRDQVRARYKDYYFEGSDEAPREDYTSENTRRLTVGEIETLLRSLPYVSDQLSL